MNPSLEGTDPYRNCRYRKGGTATSNNKEEKLPFPVLRLGTVAGLRPVINDLALEALFEYSTDPKYAAALCNERGGLRFCPPVAMAREKSGSVIKGTGMDCRGGYR